MQANGLNVTANLKAVNDFPSIPELVKAVASGKCDAGGIPEGALDQFSEELQDAQSKVSVLATSVDFPYGILLLSGEITLGTQTSLQAVFVKLAKDRTISPDLRLLLGQDALVNVDDNSFTALNEFAAATGLDFSQLGN